MKTDGIEIDIGIMNGVMSACHWLSFFGVGVYFFFESLCLLNESICLDCFDVTRDFSGQEAHQWGHLQPGAP